MIEITPRMRHSKKLQTFIEDNKLKEKRGVIAALQDHRMMGNIDYAGSDSLLKFEKGTGTRQRMISMIQKLEFTEPAECLDYLENRFGPMWSRIISVLRENLVEDPESEMIPEMESDLSVFESMADK